MKKPMRRVLYWLAVIVLGVGGLLLLPRSARSVKVTQVEQGPLSSWLAATGTVVATHQVSLGTVKAGTIASIAVSEGEAVRSGQALISLDKREADVLAQRSAAVLDQAREELNQATSALQTTREMYEAGGESRQAVLDAESKRRIEQAKLRAAEEDLRVVRMDLQNTVVRAPFSGVVARVDAQVGQWATPVSNLITVADDRVKEIQANFDADDSGSISVGQDALVTSDAFRDRQWNEHVSRLAPAIDKADTSNSFSVWLTLGSNAPPLRLGQQVDVKIVIASKPKALMVPTSAILMRAEGNAVAVVRAGVLHFVPVQVGIEDLSHAEVSGNVSVGDQVILLDNKSAVEGERVKIVNRQEPQ
jgi:RND family efflux transporter MFP subunit